MNKITILDGAMGTMIQRSGLKLGEKPEVFGLEHPDILESIQKRYVEAGSDVLYTNTFGANARKLADCAYPLSEVITANVAAARKAADSCTERKVRVALDIGPIGELMEPLGTLSFDDAYEIFKEIILTGATAGADLIIFETMTDLYEVKAGVLAAKENSSLPVWVTMTFEKTGRTFAGTSPAAMAITLDALGVDAMGVNCSLGPEDLVDTVKEIRRRTDRPLIVKPNAGLPDPRTGQYFLKPEDFARQMRMYPELGASILGGCCGTQPSFIAALKEEIEKLPEDSILQKASGQGDSGCSAGSHAANDADAAGDSGQMSPPGSVRRKNGICSMSRVTELDGAVRVIGERINPTGKKRFQAALRDHDMNYIMKCAIEQTEAGADILDVNVGLPGADEVALMKEVVPAIQSVTDLPLQIDSSTPEVIEAGLRAVNGRAIVNSVNADPDRCAAILPIVKKYGACVIGLTLKKSGMPDTAEERCANACTILEQTRRYGIPDRDVIIDCLALTVSAQQDQAMETLRAVQMVHDRLHLHCTLGVSNISFGLPMRKYATVSFLTQAMYCGLDLPIVNPNSIDIMDAVTAFRALACQDESCTAYIERFRDRPSFSAAGTVPSGAAPAAAESALQKAVISGLPDEVRIQTNLLLETKSEMDVIEQDLIPALDVVGERYEKQIIFLPQLINAANAASAGFDLIKDRIAKSGQGSVSKGKIILATVEGDIHDIGKNIVKVVLENYGYTVVDLGRDVPAEKIARTAEEMDISLIGLSALMTTTLPSMEKTIAELRKQTSVRTVVVGGAVVTPEYAASIGADYYAKDARDTVEVARKVLG